MEFEKLDETTRSQKTSGQTYKLFGYRWFSVLIIISKCMHDLLACLFKYITVAAFCIYAQCGEDAAKMVGWRQCIK